MKPKYKIRLCGVRSNGSIKYSICQRFGFVWIDITEGYITLEQATKTLSEIQEFEKLKNE